MNKIKNIEELLQTSEGRKYIADHMYNPIRCGGCSYDKLGNPWYVHGGISRTPKEHNDIIRQANPNWSDENLAFALTLNEEKYPNEYIEYGIFDNQDNLTILLYEFEININAFDKLEEKQLHHIMKTIVCQKLNLNGRYLRKSQLTQKDENAYSILINQKYYEARKMSKEWLCHIVK